MFSKKEEEHLLRPLGKGKVRITLVVAYTTGSFARY